MAGVRRKADRPIRLSAAQEIALGYFALESEPTIATGRIRGRTIRSLWNLGLLDAVPGKGNVITEAGLAFFQRHGSAAARSLGRIQDDGRGFSR